MTFTKTNNTKTYAKVDSARIKNARALGTNTACFTLQLDGIALYNMRVVQRADGKFFIAPPQTKGKDGKWYNQYAVYLDEAGEQRIIELVLKELED